MTDDELAPLYQRFLCADVTDLMYPKAKFIEAEVIKRAGLVVKGKDIIPTCNRSEKEAYKAALKDHGIATPEYTEALEIATYLWRNHYSGVSPDWEALPDLSGVLSQISNMVTGMILAPPDGWIAIEDSPAEGAWALVYADGAINCAYVEKGRIPCDWTNPTNPNIMPHYVTHWMPLPSAPKPENKP